MKGENEIKKLQLEKEERLETLKLKLQYNKNN